MGARGRWAAVIAAAVALLFAGRWAAPVLADRWWAADAAPGGASFLTGWHLLRGSLDLAAITVAAAWFTGHLLVICRAIGSVEVPHNLANLEIRSAVTPRGLAWAAAVAGLVLGILVGVGMSREWATVALAWEGIVYGVRDPVLHRDLGLYIGQLPLWRVLQGFGMVLALTGLGLVTLLYLVIGSLRWTERRLAISDHARRHLGLLLTALALAIAWGFVLAPFELVAGLGPTLDAGWQVRMAAAYALAGTCLMTSLLSAAWAWGARPHYVLAGWLVLAIAAVGGLVVVPALADTGPAPVEPGLGRRLDGLAYDLEGIALRSPLGTANPAPAPTPRLPVWDRERAGRLATGDSGGGAVLAVSPGPIGGPLGLRPVWLLTRQRAEGGVSLSAVADDRTTAAGGLVSYQWGDTLAYPGLLTFTDLPEGSLHPGATTYRLDSMPRGVVPGAWPRRAVLAWALQAGRLLAPVGPDVRLQWHRSPRARLSRLAPFAEWNDAAPRLVGGSLLWVSDGFVVSESFPLTPRVPWRGRRVSSVQAGFLGVVHPDGRTEVYLRPGAPLLAQRWAGLSGEIVQDAAAIPAELLTLLAYPEELFQVQRRVLAGDRWGLGPLAGKRAPRAEPDPPVHLWGAQGHPLAYGSAYQVAAGRAVHAVLHAGLTAGVPGLSVTRFGDEAALPGPEEIARRWGRFPLFEQLRDSIRQAGAELLPGPVGYLPGAPGLVATQAFYAAAPDRRPLAVWWSVATPGRLGAGRSLAEAWDNLEGSVVPTPPGVGPLGPLDEACRWMDSADSALRIGDWDRFGRALEALRQVLRESAPVEP